MVLTFDGANAVHINITCVSHLTQSAVSIEGKSFCQSQLELQQTGLAGCR